MQIGKVNDYVYKPLNNSLMFVYSNNEIKGTFSSGKVWGFYKVESCKFISEREEVKTYRLAVRNSYNLIEYWIYEDSSDWLIKDELKIPMQVESGFNVGYDLYSE